MNYSQGNQDGKMIKTWLLLLLTFIVSLGAIYGILRVSLRYGIYDKLDDRKIHTGNVPRLGGIGIFLGFFSGFLLFTLLGDEVLTLRSNFYSLIASGALIFVMGFWDDLKPWNPKNKFVVQSLAAILVLLGGFRFERLPLGVVGEWNWGSLSYPVTFVWIIGVTNAVNLIDGMDGLASVITASTASIYAYLFLQGGNAPAAVICGLLVVATLAFMVFNLPFPKAKIFMGDGGSQFLGFMLAVLPLIRFREPGSSLSLPIAGAILLIPLFDTIAAIWRRMREKRPIDSPDRFHIHHKLLMTGLTVRQSLGIIVLLQAVITLCVVVSGRLTGHRSDMALVLVYLVGIAFFTVMHVLKTNIQKNGLSIS